MEYKFETVNCNLCGSNNYKIISTKGKFGLPTNVVLCKECGLGYLNPRWNSESYIQFYRNEYDKYYRPVLLKNDQSVIEQNNPIATRLKKNNLFPEKVHSILDIGCGEGVNLKYFKSLLPESNLFAIEPSIESQKHLKKLGVTIIEEDVDTSWDNSYQDKFDIIILRHVLEHFMDPVKILRKIKSVLSSSGIVYIAVPDNLNPLQNLEKNWFRNVHTYYFNKHSLKNLINNTGLEILQIIEGDSFNKGEVYLIARKSNLENSPEFSKEHYQEQLLVFEEKLKKDNSIITKGIELIRKILRKLLSLFE